MNSLNAFLQKHYRREPAYVWLLLVFFFIVRIAYILAFGGFDKNEFMDAHGYDEYALNILKGRAWLTSYNFLASWREPIYPIFLAFVYFFTGYENFLAVYFLQAFLGTLTIYYIYKLSLVIIGNGNAAILSLIWAGFYIGYLRFTGELLRESLIIFLVIFFIYKMFIFIKPGKPIFRNYFILALIYTCLLHTDGRYLFYAPFLLLLFILKIKNFKASFVHYIIFGTMTIMLSVPWTIRNYITYGNIIVISKYTLEIGGGNLTERSELFDMNNIDSAYSTLHFTHNEKYPPSTERTLIKQGQNPNKRSPQEILLIKKDIYPSKSFWGRKWYHIKTMWKPFDFCYSYTPFPQAFFSTPWSLKHNLSSMFSYGILLPCFFIGLFVLIRRKSRNLYFILLPVVLHFILHALTFGIDRYRHPVDAFIIIIGCYGIICIFSKVNKTDNGSFINFSSH
jgi:hypothetical protein